MQNDEMQLYGREIELLNMQKCLSESLCDSVCEFEMIERCASCGKLQ